MIEYNIIKDKTIALLIWNTEKENDAHVYLGKIISINNAYHFINEEKKWDISFDSEQYGRLQIVLEDLKGILLNADFYISLLMGGLADDSNEDFIFTGINWQDQ
ncbi:MAG: hypothetical protein ACR2FN_01570 [Chitinophagaceae bacterium]